MNNIQYKPGDVVKLKVVRVGELGAFLDAGTGNTSDDILLHKAQQLTEVKVDEEVEVYLYLDPKGRLTASMRLPQMREGQVARALVINTTKHGAFVDIGAERGVFLPFTEMCGKVERDDHIWIKLYRDKTGRMAVTMDVAEELQRAAKPVTDWKVGQEVTGSVYNMTDQGAFLLTPERHIAFLHYSEMQKRVRPGDDVIGRITFLRPDGRVNISTRPQKENAMDVDAELIMGVLASCGDKMPYSDSTPPEVLKDKFGISKAAFKRAIGRLLKAGTIYQQDGWTYRKTDNEQ